MAIINDMRAMPIGSLGFCAQQMFRQLGIEPLPPVNKNLRKVAKTNENEDYLLIIKKIINDYKKNKYQINLDLVIFLIDIKLSFFSKSNNNTLELLDVKNEITKLFFQYRNFNLNTDAVINKLESYSNYVR